jgi:choline dehydrogenase-like flavoprotein
MTDTPFDAVVIGTGFGGSVAACRLAQAGKKVCILERGRRYPLGDFPRPAKRPDNLPHVARWAWAIDHGLWDVKDLQGVLAAQAAGYGGGSLIYANVHLRPPPEIFAPAPKGGPPGTPTDEPKNGTKEDPEGWPAIYSRRELDPYYDIVAAALRVRPLPSTLGSPSPVVRLPKVDALKRVAADLGRAQWFFMPPLAIDFGKCIMCAECVAGCQIRAKNTLDLNYLAEAEKSPDIDVRTLAEVDTIKLEDDGTYTVTYLDHITGGSKTTARGKSVFLCAGAVNSTHLLLRSKDALGIDPASKAQIGRRFFGNGDAIAMTFDTTKGGAPTPTVGPTIATTLLYNGGPAANLRAAPDAWFVLQDGGYPRWLEPVLGLFRGEFWLERNRITKGQGIPTRFDAAAAAEVTKQANAMREAMLGLMDAQKAMQSGAPQIRALTATLGLTDVLPKQIRDLGAELQRRVRKLETEQANPVSHIALDDVGEHVKTKHPLFKWAVDKGTEWADEFLVGSTLEAVHQHFLNAPPKTAQPYTPAILWPLVLGWAERLFLDRKPDDKALLMLAVGVDAAPGHLYIDDDERLLAYWDLAGNVPFSSTQERLMQDVAVALGGELRLNPDWTAHQRPVTVHCLGGCAMADAAANGVTDPNGKVWGTRGLYVLDGAAIPSSLGLNPSTTIAAIAERNVRKALADPNSPVSIPTPLPMDQGVPGWPAGMKLAEIRQQLGQTDQVLDPAKGLPPSPAPLARAVGLTFKEVMQGFYARAPFVNLPIRSDFLATIDDLNAFLVNPRRPVDIKGTVTLAPSPGAARIVYAATGTLAMLKRAETIAAVEELFREWLNAPAPLRVSRQAAVDMDWLLHRLERQAYRVEMVYDLDLTGPGGPLHFNGVKRIGWKRGFSVWQETTTLDVTLTDAAGANVGNGKMHVHVADFLGTQLPSFTVTNTDDSVRIAWAFGRFFRFFFGTLRQVYLPQLETLNPFGDRMG